MAIAYNHCQGVLGVTPTTSDTYDDGSTSFSALNKGASSTLAYDVMPDGSNMPALNISTGASSVSDHVDWGTGKFAGVTALWGRAYIYLTGTPGSAVQFFDLNTIAQIQVSTARKILLLLNSVIKLTSTTVLSLNTRYRIEWALGYPGTANQTCQFKIFLGDSTTALETSTALTAQAGIAGPQTIVRWGNTFAQASLPTLYVGGLQVNTTGFPGPAPSWGQVTGTLTLDGGTPAASAPASASGALTLGGTAAQPTFAASGALSLTGSTAAQAPVSAAGALSLSGATSSPAIAAVASGSLSLGGAATTPTIAAAASGNLSLAGAATAPAIAETAAGSLALSGTAAVKASAVVSGTLALSGTGMALGQYSAAGDLELSGTGTAPALDAAAAGALTLGGTGVTPAIAAAAAGSLTLVGSVSAQAPAAAAGSLSLAGGTPDAATETTGLGSVTLAGTAAAMATAASTGQLDLSGTASAPPIDAAASGDLTLTGTASAPTVAAAASGSLTLAGLATAQGVYTANGTLTISGSAVSASVRSASSGALVLSSAVPAPPVAAAVSGLLVLAGTAHATVHIVGISGNISFDGLAVEQALASVPTNGQLVLSASVQAPVISAPAAGTVVLAGFGAAAAGAATDPALGVIELSGSPARALQTLTWDLTLGVPMLTTAVSFGTPFIGDYAFGQPVLTGH